MPIPGIVASQITGHLALPTSYDSIATVTVGSGGSSSISFTSIPSTWKHLQIRILARAATGGAVDYNAIRMQINSDTGSNYRSHYLGGGGASAYAGATAQTTYFENVSFATGSANTANIFGVGIIDLLDYTNTNKYKVSRSLHGTDSNNTYGAVELSSGVWLNTSAITDISLFTTSSGNIAQYSSFALYGVKG